MIGNQESRIGIKVKIRKFKKYLLLEKDLLGENGFLVCLLGLGVENIFYF